MNIYKTPNDAELADYPYRINKNWCNVVWIITPQCNLGCPYCIGFADPSPAKSLLDVMSVEDIVGKLEKMRDHNKANIYITFTGGEPTLISKFIKLCKELTKRFFVIELQTNLTTQGAMKFATQVNPAKVSQIMASYHGWALNGGAPKEKRGLRDIYIRNFSKAMKEGHTIICKTIVPPGDTDIIDQRLETLKLNLPSGAPIMPWVYIHGQQYPYSYTQRQRNIMRRICKYRKQAQMEYINGAGWFSGMRCDAGRGFIVMDWDGNIKRCWTEPTPQNFVKNSVVELNNPDNPQKCHHDYCQTPFWGLWYGVNPWEYVRGARKEDAYYCRYGPKCFPENTL